MRLTLEFHSEKEITLPMHYNYYIQSFLYRHISPELGKFLHDYGFAFEKRRFKLFTFSRLRGKRYIIRNNRITFEPPVSLTISSPVDKFVNELANTLLHKDKLEFEKNRIFINSIKVHPEPEIGDTIKIQTLSPITIYSTLRKDDGSKKTYFYNPYENEFTELIDSNLRKKYEAFYGKKPRMRKLSIQPIHKFKEHTVTYRGTLIKGWYGKFLLNGNKKLLKFAYDVGLGGKNSQGFGMFEVIK
jgi:CRISPR-associated endoribonuclease Cas6